MLTERNRRASLQTETEDCQRQLKRSLAKVTALGRDREEREIKLQAKQVLFYIFNFVYLFISLSLLCFFEL